MKYTLFAFMAAVFLGLTFAPQGAQAASSYVGISEKTYFALKHGHCYFNPADAPKGSVALQGTTTLCDPLLARLDGKTVMRVHNGGKLYVVNTGDGAPTLIPTLRAGLYRANGKYYYVNGTVKIRVDMDNPRVAALHVAQYLNAGGQKVVGVNNATFRALFGSDDAPREKCKCAGGSQAIDVQAVQTSLAGKIIMNIDEKGAMYYVPANIVKTGANPIKVTKANAKQLKKQATPISAKKLKNIGLIQ